VITPLPTGKKRSWKSENPQANLAKRARSWGEDALAHKPDTVGKKVKKKYGEGGGARQRDVTGGGFWQNEEVVSDRLEERGVGRRDS